MTPFTPAELDILRWRMTGAVFGLQQELAYRRHPLTGKLPRDQRYDLADLIRLRRHYVQLAALADNLSRLRSLAEMPQPADDLLAFVREELELTCAASKYVKTQPFSRRTKATLLRLLEIETRFFNLVIDHLQPRGDIH